ncbi:hypothetical protein ACQPZP_34255 [Spirillospora sp. CA-142024]|uniref:hypothetical protein n=1 Tax=Spirillospora sp. CA-142024 TaxID=3240036 RepID=UPI003D911027
MPPGRAEHDGHVDQRGPGLTGAPEAVQAAGVPVREGLVIGSPRSGYVVFTRTGRTSPWGTDGCAHLVLAPGRPECGAHAAVGEPWGWHLAPALQLGTPPECSGG